MRVLNKIRWPHTTTTRVDYAPAPEWCDSVLGKKYKDWYTYDIYNERVYAFKDIETMLIFKLGCRAVSRLE